MSQEMLAMLAARKASTMSIREAAALAAAQMPARGGSAESAAPPEDAASSFAEDAPIGDSASMACDEEPAGEVAPHELTNLAGMDFRTLPLAMTEDEAVTRMRYLVAQDPALAEPAAPGQPSLVSEAFLVACANCNAKVASHLLQMRADVNVNNPENNWTPLIATMYEPSFNSSAALVRLLLNARAKVDIWAKDHLRGWCALDYAREYEDFVLRLDPLGFSGEDIADYRAYVGELEVHGSGGSSGSGSAPLAPADWRRENPAITQDALTPPAECLATVRGCIALVARHLDCPAAVFSGVAPGGCRRAYDAHVAAGEGAAAEAAKCAAEARAAEAEAGARAAREAAAREAARAEERQAEAGAGQAAVAAALLQGAAASAAAAAASAAASAAAAAAAGGPLAPLALNTLPDSSSDASAAAALLKEAAQSAAGRAAALAAAAAAAAAAALRPSAAALKAHHAANTLVSLALIGLVLAAALCGVRLWDIEARAF